MLNSVLIVGVPMVALLAAAFYIYKRTQAETASHGPGGGGVFSREPWGVATATNRQSSTNPRRRNTRNRREASNSNNSQGSPYESPDSGFADEDQCEICFEDVAKVQLYPCKHSDICETCVNKLLISKRECPFCRSRIDGYVEIHTGTMFG